jgi:hypothetical protein
MPKITVLLAIQPRLLSEVIQRLIERQPDMEVVKEGSEVWSVLTASSLGLRLRQTKHG